MVLPRATATAALLLLDPYLATLIGAATEIGMSQLGAGKLETISTTAGRLLVEKGVAKTVDDGIVIFHTALGETRPSLRKVLRKFDESAGRVPRKRVTGFALVVKQLPVKRDVHGHIAKVTPQAKAVLARQAKVAGVSAHTLAVLARVNGKKK